MADGYSSGEAGPVTVHLLDAAQGRPIQTWHFKGKAQVTIGRAEENDVGVTDPLVSRLHAELRYVDGGWVLVSQGRNGTIVDGERIDETSLRDQTVFQLGGAGPSFKFCLMNESRSNLATVHNIDLDNFDFLKINDEEKQQQVQQILDNDTFKVLQEQSRKLKNS